MEECEVIDPIVIEKETIIARAAMRDMEQKSSGVSGATVGLALREDEEQDEMEDQ